MNKKTINILAIESSCDETAASVVQNGRVVLSNVISSQIEIHKKYGGVVPEIASRKHIENISTVVEEAISESKLSVDEIDAIAVTYGPGLVGALLIGVNYAKSLAYAWNKPLIGVNHIEGHISANYIEDKTLEPPFVCLVVSGGHTHLVYVKDYGSYEIMGRTRDDAAGEAYDKIARALNLGYPGGPNIDKLAKLGNRNAIHFPRAKFNEESLDFSFSGLKSAVLNYINQTRQKGEEVIEADVAACFQEAVIDVLVGKLMQAASLKNCRKIALAGGVASNTRLREVLQKECENNNLSLYRPSPILCTDNAAMIGSCAFFKYNNKEFADFSLNANSNLEIGKV